MRESEYNGYSPSLSETILLNGSYFFSSLISYGQENQRDLYNQAKELLYYILIFLRKYNKRKEFFVLSIHFHFIKFSLFFSFVVLVL